MILTEKPSEIRKRHRSLERKAHDLFISESAYRSGIAMVRVHHQGRLIELRAPLGWEEHEKKRGERKAITHFSSKSRRAQLVTVARIRRDAPLPLFVHLTYPAVWPQEPEIWKDHWNAFSMAVKSRFPERADMWKLEPQKRWAPHFHALIWNVERIPWQWIAVNWARIIHNQWLPNDYPVADGRLGAKLFADWVDDLCVDELVKDSLKAGTRIEAVDSAEGVMFYCAKYLGKECPVSDEWEHVGRYWGVGGRKFMPWSAVEEIAVSRRTAVCMKRLVRRYLRSKGVTVGTMRENFTLFTSNMEVWLRAFEWCCEVADGACDEPF